MNLGKVYQFALQESSTALIVKESIRHSNSIITCKNQLCAVRELLQKLEIISYFYIASKKKGVTTMSDIDTLSLAGRRLSTVSNAW